MSTTIWTRENIYFYGMLSTIMFLMNAMLIHLVATYMIGWGFLILYPLGLPFAYGYLTRIDSGLLGNRYVLTALLLSYPSLVTAGFVQGIMYLIKNFILLSIRAGQMVAEKELPLWK